MDSEFVVNPKDDGKGLGVDAALREFGLVALDVDLLWQALLGLARGFGAASRQEQVDKFAAVEVHFVLAPKAVGVAKDHA